MSRVRVKICGITNFSDALSAVNAGVDALGFVFYEPSPRYISPIEAKKIIEQLPPFVTTVGLFVNASQAFIEECISITKLDLLQFHGDETQPFCSGFARPYIKAIRVKQESDIYSAFETYSNASGLLLDTYVKGSPGGTGKSFDWSIIPPQYRKQVILAGGLDKRNVAKAIEQIHPYAVDVSGGVEASKGKKDPLLINSFMNEVNCV